MPPPQLQLRRGGSVMRLGFRAARWGRARAWWCFGGGRFPVRHHCHISSGAHCIAHGSARCSLLCTLQCMLWCTVPCMLHCMLRCAVHGARCSAWCSVWCGACCGAHCGVQCCAHCVVRCHAQCTALAAARTGGGTLGVGWDGAGAGEVQGAELEQLFFIQGQSILLMKQPVSHSCSEMNCVRVTWVLLLWCC